MREHDFYLGSLRLPITPASIETKIKNKNEVIEILSGYDLNLIRNPGLTEFSFDFRLPNVDYPSVGAFVEPIEVLNLLEKYKTAKNKEDRVFQFIIIRHTEGLVNSINKAVTLEDYDIKEDFREAGDLIISVRLKKYIPLKTRELKTKEENGSLKASFKSLINRETPIQKAMVVGSGMTLNIASKLMFKNMNSRQKQRSLRALNGLKSNLLNQGQVLKLVEDFNKK